MKKSVLLFGMLGGVLIATLKLLEYRFLVLDRSLEIYGGLVALLFAVVGIWLGSKITRRREVVVLHEVHVPAPVFLPNRTRQAELGITARELEILGLIAAGLSTREIAERVFVSENTVKTHTARVYAKLSAKRRTQAVRHAREQGLIP